MSTLFQVLPTQDPDEPQLCDISYNYYHYDFSAGIRENTPHCTQTAIRIKNRRGTC